MRVVACVYPGATSNTSDPRLTAAPEHDPISNDPIGVEGNAERRYLDGSSDVATKSPLSMRKQMRSRNQARHGVAFSCEGR